MASGRPQNGPQWVHTRCPLNGSDKMDRELYPARVQLEQLDADLFSARRVPDRIHYRMVRNIETGCLRADPILDDSTILNLYRRSSVTYSALTSDIIQTYVKYAEPIWDLLIDRRGVLEIGCGSGPFLAAMRERGFERVAGVEPSNPAASQAEQCIKAFIHVGTLDEHLYAKRSFSLICGFQVLDHLPKPNETLRICHSLLAPGGCMYWICHDIGSWTARLLGERCPMIDIEHVVLYDKKTLVKLFENNGFIVRHVFGVSNEYPLSYWHQLAPLPAPIKAKIAKVLNKTRISKVKLRANLGNIGIIARTPIPSDGMRSSDG